MTSDNASTPDGPDRLDWDRYEAELEAQAATSARTGGGTVDPNLATAGEGRVLVDSPAAQRPPRPGLAGLRAAQRRPIVPAWLRSRNELAQVCRWAAGFAAHTSAYHLTRTPTYAGRLAARAPRGTARLLGGWLRWLLDLEGEPVRQATVRAQDAEAYLKLARQRDRRVRWRATLTVLLAVAVVLATITLLVAPPAVRWSAMALLIAALGVAGAPADRPLLERAVIVPRAARLTSEMVVRALSVLSPIPPMTCFQRAILTCKGRSGCGGPCEHRDRVLAGWQGARFGRASAAGGALGTLMPAPWASGAASGGGGQVG